MKAADGLSDSERLYLSALVAYDNPNFNKVFEGNDAKGNPQYTTWCNAYAADVLYLFNGSTDLMNSSVDPKHPENYGNFADPTKGDWTLATSPGQKTVLNDSNKFTPVTTTQGAQSLANQGKFVVGFTDDHILIIMPGLDKPIETMYRSSVDTTKRYPGLAPAIAQEGKHQYLFNTSENGTMDYAYSYEAYLKVKYYEFEK